MDANTNHPTTRIAALHDDIFRLVQGEPHLPPTQADLGTALELADLAMELAQRGLEHNNKNKTSEAQADLIDRCGRLQGICYDLVVDMYSNVEEFEHKAYAERKMRAALRQSHRRMSGGDDGEDVVVAAAAAARSRSSSFSSSCFLSLSGDENEYDDDDEVSSPASSTSSGRSVTFWDEGAPGSTTIELSLRLRDHNGKDEGSPLAEDSGRRPVPVLRRQKGQHFDGWNGVC
ncbi:hypothetical protein UCREL1_6268 [Eutypa lata UCREL1]|uniref:Uncharacterized protein n=1 Tax=Eutypa lata (strain UCR-EL1) TaxID=1287681 RepID=M7TJ19_EUTLA|nr:hypothetical protein UCREL1_6268 [Eutypa lata UCREL1]